MRFTLTEEHIKLVRRMCVGWQDCEFGAPEIDPKRPYGNSDVLDDMREILEHGMAHDELLQDLHRETKTALQIILSIGTFQPGTYESKWGYDWSLVEQTAAKECPYCSPDGTVGFPDGRVCDHCDGSHFLWVDSK